LKTAYTSTKRTEELISWLIQKINPMYYLIEYGIPLQEAYENTKSVVWDDFLKQYPDELPYSELDAFIRKEADLAN